MAPTPDEVRSEYNITFWYWRATDLWLAFYPCLPHYKGTGPTMGTALDDLRSRERVARTDGEITFYSLGHKLFARYSSGFGQGEKHYGVGSSTSEALVDLIGGSISSSFRYVDSEWICTRGNLGSRGKTARMAANQLAEAERASAHVDIPHKQVSSQVDGFTIGSKGSSAVGTGKTIEEAVSSFWIQESKSVVSQTRAIINTHGTMKEIEDFERLLRRAGLKEDDDGVVEHLGSDDQTRRGERSGRCPVP